MDGYRRSVLSQMSGAADSGAARQTTLSLCSSAWLTAVVRQSAVKVILLE
jgi:hypothetical protein